MEVKRHLYEEFDKSKLRALRCMLYHEVEYKSCFYLLILSMLQYVFSFCCIHFTGKLLTTSVYKKSKSNPTSVTILKLSYGEAKNWDMRVISPALQISVGNCMTDDGKACVLKDSVKLTSSMTYVDFDDRGFSCLSLNTSGQTLNMSATHQDVNKLLAVPLLIYFKGLFNI